MKVGLISDTHGTIPIDVLSYLEDCDQIWHAGDIGAIEALGQLPEQKCAHWVWGNIDDHQIRSSTKEWDVFDAEGIKVLMIHIGGYPGRYQGKASELIEEHSPDLFISGHSHILKIIRDKKRNLLHFNPGACGFKGFHKVRTFIRFNIQKGKISDVEVIELEQRHSRS